MHDAVLLFVDDDWCFGGLDEVCDPLDEALMAAGVGEVAGGGIGGGFTRLELSLTDAAGALVVLRRELTRLGAPASTLLRDAAGTRRLLVDGGVDA